MYRAVRDIRAYIAIYLPHRARSTRERAICGRRRSNKYPRKEPGRIEYATRTRGQRLSRPHGVNCSAAVRCVQLSGARARGQLCVTYDHTHRRTPLYNCLALSLSVYSI